MSINDMLISNQWPRNINQICKNAIPVITQAEISQLDAGQTNSLESVQDVVALMVLAGKSYLGQTLTTDEMLQLSNRPTAVNDVCDAIKARQEDELRYLLKDSLLAKEYLDQIRVGRLTQILQYGWTRGYLRSIGTPFRK